MLVYPLVSASFQRTNALWSNLRMLLDIMSMPGTTADTSSCVSVCVCRCV